ncbi:hypothetical protein B0H16DRAFT_1803377 [Mycena metata]|uniref:Uncharacterized protein n=1 Tax=Mycena metata TaxID=1033252 RepID=A0AAD7KCV4_9AGAR|nr:hypothetical protein B0H16DRAFT_1803377 [Mycena metata]
MASRTLKIPEIVGLICEQLCECSTSISPILARIALVSPLFANECLARLWYSQSGLLNFLRLLPGDCYIINNRKVETMFLERALTPKDFERPMLYGPRIKHFYCRELPPASVCSALAQFAPGGLLFPHLNRLEFNIASTTPTTFPYISLFMGSSLESVHLVAEDDSTSFLTTYSTHCARLKHFSMFTKGRSSSTGMTIAFNAFVANLAQINSVDVDSMAYKSFGPLSAQTTLQTLVIRENNRIPFELACIYHFPSLVDFQLHFSNFKTMVRMLDAMRMPQLSSIEMDSVGAAKAHRIRAVFERLQQQAPGLQFHELMIDTDVDTLPTDVTPDYTITLHTIEPLLSSVALSRVDLQLNEGFDLSDACVARVAEAWPMLEILRLTMPYKSRRAVASSITLAGLQAFAHHCPFLTTLALVLDGTVEAPKFEPSDTISQQYSLRTLEVGVSSQRFPLIAADLLATVFPTLIRIETYWETSGHMQDESESAAAWHFVESMLIHGVKVRKRERLWGRLHGSSLPAICEDEDSD